MKSRRRKTFEAQVKYQIKNSKLSAPFFVSMSKGSFANYVKLWGEGVMDVSTRTGGLGVNQPYFLKNRS